MLGFRRKQGMGTVTVRYKGRNLGLLFRTQMTVLDVVHTILKGLSSDWEAVLVRGGNNLGGDPGQIVADGDVIEVTR